MTPAEIKQYLNKPVRYKDDKSGVDSLYILSGAIFRKKENGYFYQAELQAMNGSRSITICKLEDVSLAETTNGGIS